MHPAETFLTGSVPRLRWLGAPLTSGQEACKATLGDPAAIVSTLVHMSTRALILGLGISLFEKDLKKILMQAVGGTVAVEAFIVGWNFATGCEPLPSGDAAERFVQSKPGSAAGVLGSMAVRGAIIAAGVAVAGEKDTSRLVKKSAAAVSALELSLLVNAMR